MTAQHLTPPASSRQVSAPRTPRTHTHSHTHSRAGARTTPRLTFSLYAPSAAALHMSLPLRLRVRAGEAKAWIPTLYLMTLCNQSAGHGAAQDDQPPGVPDMRGCGVVHAAAEGPERRGAQALHVGCRCDRDDTALTTPICQSRTSWKKRVKAERTLSFSSLTFSPPKTPRARTDRRSGVLSDGCWTSMRHRNRLVDEDTRAHSCNKLNWGVT